MGQSESMALKLSMLRPCKEHLKMELGNGDTIVEGAFFNECNEDKESAGAAKCKSLNLKDFFGHFSILFYTLSWRRSEVMESRSEFPRCRKKNACQSFQWQVRIHACGKANTRLLSTFLHPMNSVMLVKVPSSFQ